MSAFTQDQLAALQRYLDSLEPSTRARGLKYFEEGKVRDLECYKRGVGVRANVAGSQYRIYRVKLRWVGGEWDGECSCPMALDCKHCGAVALQALAEFHDGAVAAAEPVVTPVVTDAGDDWQFTYELPSDMLGGAPVVLLSKADLSVKKAYRTQ